MRGIYSTNSRGKITRGIATIEFLIRQNKVGSLLRLPPVVIGKGFFSNP
jgi:hypothetical protein